MPAENEEDARILTAFKAECDKVGVPYDPAGLVRHHRGNAGMAASATLMGDQIVILRRMEALKEAITRRVDGPLRDGQQQHDIEFSYDQVLRALTKMFERSS